MNDNSASFFGELGGFMKPYRGKYTLSVLISILSVACGVGAYGFAGRIASLLFGQKPGWKLVLGLALGAAACKVVSVLLLNLSTWISHRAAYFTLRDIRNALSEKMLRLPLGYFETSGSGRLKTLMVDRVETMEKTLAHMLPELTANLLAPLVCMVWMFFIDWRLALCTVLWILLGFGVTGGMMKGYEEKFAGQIKALKGMNQAVVEYVNGIEVIKNFGRADECYEKYQGAVYGHASYNVNWQKETQKYTALGMAIAPFSLFPILIAGLIFYARGTVDGGTLFLMVLLSFGIFGPLMNASSYFDQLAGMGTSAKEIRDVLDYPELNRTEGPLPTKLDVDFRDVSFSYTKDGDKALDRVSFHVPQGSMFAMVGPSGSGKSTVAKLLAGFWDASEGEISIGGTPITACSQEQLNSLMAYVDQDTFLFDKTILDNIRMGRPDATDEEVMAAAKKAGCDGFISALPEGYQTRAGTAGGRLSGGERQRIAIVRAMLKDAPIMILDEATSSTDPENEASIQQALTAASQGKTLIVVAHRLATVMHAEQIAFVKNGKIQALGTHPELLETCPEYRAMWELSEVKEDA